ncbi:hypothetical protein KAI52_00030 [Candidatus Parcubacteria bacterium]|nr:hypothetical protein [Candidatus Parcubacteria bacterium]
MKNSKSKIKYSDFYGLRKEKFEFLKSHSVKNTKWQNLEAKEPFCFFVPKDFRLEGEYSKFISVKDIFEKYNAGIATGKDDVLVGFNKQDLTTKLSIRDKGLFEITMQNYGVKKDLVKRWRNELKNIEIDEQIKKYNYRPFDDRFIIYNQKILQRARRKIMDNFLGDNLGLVMMNNSKLEIFNEIFITNFLSDKHLIGHQSYVFPLYLYDQYTEQKNCSVAMFDKLDKPAKRSNIKKEILEMLKAKYNKIIKPEEVFNYIYAVLYSNKYRKKYQEFLKIDFPRIPFAKDYKLFKELSKIGKELIDLHLLKNRKLKKTTAKFCGIGLNKIEKREYNKKEKRLYISENQYFENVGLEVWEYYIGGYQVLDKWIKDRIGKNLSAEEAGHYLKIIESLQQTIEAQKKIDGLFLKL